MFDKEQAIKVVEDILKENLGCFIDAVNTEKKDNITLEHVPLSSYHLSLPELPNEKLLINLAYIPGSGQNVSNVGMHGLIGEIDVDLAFAATGNDQDYYKALRYEKALNKLFVKHARDYEGLDIKIESSDIPGMFKGVMPRYLVSVRISLSIH